MLYFKTLDFFKKVTRVNNVDDIKKTSIVDYLHKNGYKSINSHGKYVSFYSPFSREGNASFKVNTLKNTFSDYHAQKFGDIIDLVMEMEHLSFKNACKFLERNESISIEQYTPIKKQESGIKIHDSREVSDRKLINYFVNERKIADNILKKYCKEVDFSFPYGKNPDKVHTAIGFFNDMGGVELRNDWIKVSSSPKGFTTIKGDSKEINLFEGFADFLAALTYFRVDKPKHKTYILNGVSQLNVLKPMLEGKKVNLFVDADEAGDEVKNQLDRVNDCRHYFCFDGDFNEMLKNL